MPRSRSRPNRQEQATAEARRDDAQQGNEQDQAGQSQQGIQAGDVPEGIHHQSAERARQTAGGSGGQAPRQKSVATARTFAATHPSQVLAAGRELPNARAASVRAVYGSSAAEEDALARKLRTGQVVRPRAAALLQRAQAAIRAWLCTDSDILQMTKPLREFLRGAAGSAGQWQQHLQIIDRLQGQGVDEGLRSHALYGDAQALAQHPFSASVQAAVSALPSQATPITFMQNGRSISDWVRIQKVLSPPAPIHVALSAVRPRATVEDLLQHVRWYTRDCTLDEDSKWFVAEVLLQGQDASGQTLARARRHALNRIHAAAEQYRALGPPGTEVLVHVVPTSGSIGVPIKELDRKGALHNLYQSTLPAV